MPKKIVYYECNDCGERYAEHADAEQCEKKHIKITKVDTANYTAGASYPYSIVVLLENGMLETYWKM